MSQPVALTPAGIREILTDYRSAAYNAKQAGFDGVEIHAANGYLIDQFLHSGSNQRSDVYGGTASNRVRFLTEVTEKVLEVWNKKRIGVRISPTGTFNDMHDDNPEETFGLAVERLNSYRLGYLHVVESTQDGRRNNGRDWALLRHLREQWTGFYIVNGGYDGARGKEAVLLGYADAVAYGRAFLANPICQSVSSSEPHSTNRISKLSTEAMPEATRIIPIFPEMETTASFPSASTTRLEVGLIASDGAAGITRVQHIREKRSAV